MQGGLITAPGFGVSYAGSLASYTVREKQSCTVISLPVHTHVDELVFWSSVTRHLHTWRLGAVRYPGLVVLRLLALSEFGRGALQCLPHCIHLLSTADGQCRACGSLAYLAARTRAAAWPILPTVDCGMLWVRRPVLVAVQPEYMRQDACRPWLSRRLGRLSVKSSALLHHTLRRLLSTTWVTLCLGREMSVLRVSLRFWSHAPIRWPTVLTCSLDTASSASCSLTSARSTMICGCACMTIPRAATSRLKSTDTPWRLVRARRSSDLTIGA